MSALAPAPVSLPAATWAVDPVHSSIGFQVRHLGVSTFRGSFAGVTGRIVTRDGAVAAVEGAVPVEGLRIEDDALRGHLLTPDFFDAASHPEARFVSTTVEPVGESRLRVEGDLTLRGVTRPVVLEGEVEGVGADPYGNTRIGLSATGEIDRTAFGISWNAALDNGAVAVAETVRLVLAVEAIAEAA